MHAVAQPQRRATARPARNCSSVIVGCRSEWSIMRARSATEGREDMGKLRRKKEELRRGKWVIAAKSVRLGFLSLPSSFLIFPKMFPAFKIEIPRCRFAKGRAGL